jgi:hypothetical protein
MEKKERKKTGHRENRTFPFENEIERKDKERKRPKRDVRGHHIFYREYHRRG